MTTLVVRLSCARNRFTQSLLFFVSGVVAALPGTQSADASPPVVRIEEDWEVVIGVPDPDADSPQVIAVISPQEDLDSTTYAVFELNHSTLPDFEGGGMQLQAWVGDLMVDHRNHHCDNVLATDNETVKFTLSMALSDGSLEFAVLNGCSTTWGDFGETDHLKCSVATAATDLGTYESFASTRNSRVGFASHRVRKFVRTEVRYYSSSELLATDATPVIVHEYNPTENE